jgi:hypothetical protein
VDAATGTVTTLLPGEAGGGIYNTPDEPYLARDGQLYFFYAQVSAPDGYSMRAPLKMVRSAPDGVTDRIALNEREFKMLNEALWSPDASFVIVASAPLEEVYEGGQAEVVYVEGKPSVPLATFVKQMKWGP